MAVFRHLSKTACDMAIPPDKSARRVAGHRKAGLRLLDAHALIHGRAQTDAQSYVRKAR